MLNRFTVIAVLSAFASLTAVSVSTANAQVVLGPVSISSPGRPVSVFTIQNLINQSGLTVGYTSGVTDFTSYVASTLVGRSQLDNGLVIAEAGDARLFSFDLGAEYVLSEIGVWAGPTNGLIREFALFADNDIDFTNGVGAQMLGSTALAIDVQAAQAFSFGEIRTRYVHFNVPTVDARSMYGLGEVVFGGRTAAPVPEPRALALFLTGLVLLAGAAMRRRA